MQMDLFGHRAGPHPDVSKRRVIGASEGSCTKGQSLLHENGNGLIDTGKGMPDAVGKVIILIDS